jgi:hypothetical protein
MWPSLMYLVGSKIWVYKHSWHPSYLYLPRLQQRFPKLANPTNVSLFLLDINQVDIVLKDTFVLRLSIVLVFGFM